MIKTNNNGDNDETGRGGGGIKIVFNKLDQCVNYVISTMSHET